MIIAREKVRAAVERALLLHHDTEAAIAAVAQAMGLAVEVVRDALEEVEA